MEDHVAQLTTKELDACITGEPLTVGPRIAKAAGRKLIEYVEASIAYFDGQNLLVTGQIASSKWAALREAYGLPKKRRSRRRP